ncbi:4Fe-4S dicluster domain-containing protein [Paraeggerthella sp. LCP19S3_G8]|uniref:4Fe-4S dicluster domain-containing protein n=1 Tax=Paraeggerthella sp. LCP19S3_G8 TaxID=3440248 RepID=UPI002A88CBB0|nr:4Fe-4S dicluster domain-containing protein [Paraeggerthella sp.]
MTEKAILFDSSRCSACRGCQVACKMWNNLPSTLEKNGNPWTGSYQSPMDLNGDTRLLISFHEEAGGDKGVMWSFGRRSCQHCADAPCATICPGGALAKDEETGFVSVDESKCIGCQYCKSACPFDVPRYHGPNSKINKCTGCLDRVEQGMQPACVTTCQPEALKFGDREEMLAIARERVAYLQGKGFADACVYGEDEIGGLHVIQVLKHGVEAHGQVENPQVNPMVGLTQIMKPVTGAVTGLTVAGLAAMFVLGIGYKRDKLAYNAETEDTLSVDSGNVLKHGDGQDEETVMEHITENLPGKKGGN